jgi:Flp pilus assembly pilin Flp
MFIFGLIVGLVIGAFLSLPILTLLKALVAWIKTKLGSQS